MSKQSSTDFYKSYKNQFQAFFGIGEVDKANCGLNKLLSSKFPRTFERFDGIYCQEYIGFSITLPVHTAEECIKNGYTYEAPLSINICQTIYNNHGKLTSKENITWELSSILLVTDNNEFIVNGKTCDLFNQVQNAEGISIPDNEKACIKDVNGNKIYLSIKNGKAFVKIRNCYIPYTTIIRYLHGKSSNSEIWNGTNQDLFDLFSLARPVKVSKNNLQNSYYCCLAEDVCAEWIEDYVDEETGDILSTQRRETVIPHDTYIDKDFYNDYKEIFQTLKTKEIYVKVYDLPAIKKILLDTIYSDPTRNEIEAIAYLSHHLLNKDIYSVIHQKVIDEEDLSKIKKEIDSLLFPEIGLIGRASINLILGYDYPVNLDDIPEPGTDFPFGSTHIEEKDYQQLLNTLVSMRYKIDEYGRSIAISEKERKSTIIDCERIFSILVQKELCRFEFAEDNFNMGFIVFQEYINRIRKFSVIESILYNSLPLIYATDIDIEEADGNIAYNFTGEKLLKCKDKNLTNIIIRDGTRAICNDAFNLMCSQGCIYSHGMYINKLIFPNSLEEIGECAFGECWLLCDLIFPESLVEIHDYAFNRSYFELKRIYIPKNVRRINYAFSECINVMSIEVHPDNKFFSSEKNILYDKRKTKVILCAKNENAHIKLPKTVKSIESSAFSFVEAKSLEIPEGAMAIKPYAFVRTMIKHFILPSANLKVSLKAFTNCTFYKITISDNNVNLIKKGNCLCSPDYKQIYVIESKEIVRIPKGVKCISNIHLTGATKRLILPKGLSAIKSHSIKFISPLDIVLPQGVSSISEHAFDSFDNWRELIHIYVPKNCIHEDRQKFPSLRDLMKEF